MNQYIISYTQIAIDLIQIILLIDSVGDFFFFFEKTKRSFGLARFRARFVTRKNEFTFLVWLKTVFDYELDPIHCTCESVWRKITQKKKNFTSRKAENKSHTIFLD